MKPQPTRRISETGIQRLIDAGLAAIGSLRACVGREGHSHHARNLEVEIVALVDLMGAEEEQPKQIWLAPDTAAYLYCAGMNAIRTIEMTLSDDDADATALDRQLSHLFEELKCSGYLGPVAPQVWQHDSHKSAAAIRRTGVNQFDVEFPGGLSPVQDAPPSDTRIGFYGVFNGSTEPRNRAATAEEMYRDTMDRLIVAQDQTIAANARTIELLEAELAKGPGLRLESAGGGDLNDE